MGHVQSPAEIKGHKCVVLQYGQSKEQSAFSHIAKSPHTSHQARWTKMIILHCNYYISTIQLVFQKCLDYSSAYPVQCLVQNSKGNGISSTTSTSHGCNSSPDTVNMERIQSDLFNSKTSFLQTYSCPLLSLQVHTPTPLGDRNSLEVTRGQGTTTFVSLVLCLWGYVGDCNLWIFTFPIVSVTH